MPKNVITIISFIARIGSQVLILFLAFRYLNYLDYQVFLLLSFLGTFLSIFDFGLLSIATKKLSYVHHQTSHAYSIILSSIYKTLGLMFLVICIIFLLIQLVFTNSDISNLDFKILLTYFFVFKTNYIFSLISNLNFSIENVYKARIFEIIKHFLNMLSAVIFIYFMSTIQGYFLGLIFFNLAVSSISGYSFYSRNIKRTKKNKEFRNPLSESEIQWKKDFIRSSGSDIIFKITLFYLVTNITNSIPVEESNIVLTVIKIMDMCSILTLQLLWSNIRYLSSLKISWQVFKVFCSIYGSILLFLLLTGYILSIIMNINIVSDMIILIMLSGYFFWVWRCIAFFELLTNLKDIYWQHRPFIIILLSISTVQFFKLYIQNLPIILEMVMLLPSCHIIYFYFIKSTIQKI